MKNVILKELQKRLKNYYHAVGEQVFSMHCSENAFVGVFGAYVTHYSLCSSFYLCSFKGENAVETIGVIFDNDKWYKRDYGSSQWSFVWLYSPEEQERLEINNKPQQAKKKLKKNYLQTEK